MREYEFGIVLHPDLNDKKLDATVEKYENVMKSNGGEILYRNPWGVKKLAYPIKDSTKGNYMFYNVANDGDCVKEMERLMKLDENVLRFLTVKISDEVNVEQRKVELAKAPEKEEETENDAESKEEDKS